MTNSFRVSGEGVTLHDNPSCDSLTVLTQYQSGKPRAAPAWQMSRRTTAWCFMSSRLRVIALAILVLLVALLLAEGYASDLSLKSLVSVTSRQSQCQDPYLMHGYLLHNNSAAKARWIPYTDSILHSTDVPAILPPKRDETIIANEVLDMAPPSFASMLEEAAQNSLESLRVPAAALEPLRNKVVLILGCSLDRFFMVSMCPRFGAEFLNMMDDMHGILRCVIPSINLEIQLWFTFGALPEQKTLEETGRPITFEDRIQHLWIPAAERLNLTTNPDVIIWASGTWDVLGLRKRFREQDKKAWVEQAMSFQELAWHRMRLNEMIAFIRNRWPNVPALYRPPTYTYDKELPSWNDQFEGVLEPEMDLINEGVWRLTQSAKVVMENNNMPTFTWADKLIGNNQYADPTHFRGDSYAQWLYAEMLLYYVHYYSMPIPSHCVGKPN